ncbi:hypothetical protein NHJ13734_009646 [Beauveria thailandica]
MALARFAMITVSCLLFLFLYSSTCVAIPVYEEIGNPKGNANTAAEKGGLHRFSKVDGLAPDEIVFRSSAPHYVNNDKDQEITPETIEAFKEYGITHVINANREAKSRAYSDALEAAGIKYTPIPTKDFTAPTQKALNKAWDGFVSNKPGATLIHCGYGDGRTGVVVTSIQMRSEHQRGILRRWGIADYRRNRVEYENAMGESTGQAEALNEFQDNLKKEGRTAGGGRCILSRKRAECLRITPSKEEGTSPEKGEPIADLEKDVAEIDEVKITELVESVSEKEFGELLAKRGLVDIVKKKWSLDNFRDFRTKRLGYKPLTETAVKSGSRALQKLKVSKGGLSAIGIGLWIVGTAQAATSDTATDWDKAAAGLGIVPFVGCGASVIADAEKGEADWVDTTLCVTADALLLSPAAPIGILLHIYRFLFKLSQPEEIPKFEHMQAVRDAAWTSVLNEKVYTRLYSDESFRARLKGSFLFTDVAVLSRAARRISLTSPEVLSAMEGSPSDADKAEIQSLSESAANEIREGISNETIRTQRQLLVHLPDQLVASAEPYAKSLAEQFNKEFAAELVSDKLASKYTRYYGGTLPKIVPPTNNLKQVKDKLKSMAERFSPVRLPNRFDIAYIIGQSKGLQEVDPLILSPRDFLQTQEPDLRESDRDSLLLFHTLEISRLLSGEKTEDELDGYWPSAGNATNLLPLQILVAVQYGKIFEEVKMKYPQKEQDEFNNSPSLPHAKGLLDELQSPPYLSLSLGLGDEVISNLPKDPRYKTYNGLFRDEEFVQNMLRRAIQLQADKGHPPADN